MATIYQWLSSCLQMGTANWRTFQVARPTRPVLRVLAIWQRRTSIHIEVDNSSWAPAPATLCHSTRKRHLRMSQTGVLGICRSMLHLLRAMASTLIRMATCSAPAFDPCLSACAKYNQDSYCCTGGYDGPGKCSPNYYSKAAKSVCPDAYSYAYDDQDSTFIVPEGAGFQVIFCPGGRSTNIIATR